MGDIRFSTAYEHVRDDPNRVAAIRALTDEQVVGALAAASRERDPLVANFLATEAMNRIHQGRAVLESLPVAVVTLDRDGRVTSFNEAAERLLGQLRGERLGRPFFPAGGGAEAALEEGVAAALAGEFRGLEERVAIPAAGGRRIFVRASASPLWSHGRVGGVILLLDLPGLRPFGGG